MDCAFADDEDPADDANEQIGRFCPITNGVIDDCNTYDSITPNTPGYTTGTWRYHFATRLLDYFTVQSPETDLKPNVDPNVALGTQTKVQNSNTYLGANGADELTAGVDGLVNINTAPWWVIASLPLLPNDLAGPASGSIDLNNNGIPDNIENLAKSIVLYRDGLPGQNLNSQPNYPHGPFRSIWDLNRVPAVASPAPPFVGTTAIPAFKDALKTYAAGAGTYTAGVTGDFEENTLMVNRISNLITTRSDTFTVYIVIQGWRNAGTARPSLVVTKRAAFIVDRNNITAAGGATPKTTSIAND